MPSYQRKEARAWAREHLGELRGILRGSIHMVRRR